MKRSSASRLIVKAVSIVLITVGFAPLSHGGVVTTGEMLGVQAQEARIRDIDAFLDRQAVRDELIRYGVSPDAVSARLHNLTAEELSRLHGAIGDEAAGGDALAIIGAVFLVLLILELLGVTNVFSAI